MLSPDPTELIVTLAAHPYYKLSPHADIDFGATLTITK